MMRREREPGASPGLSRSGMQERQLPEALAPMGWEAAAIRYTRQRVWACESEYLPNVPGAPHPAVHRLAEWARSRQGASRRAMAIGFVRRERLCI